MDLEFFRDTHTKPMHIKKLEPKTGFKSFAKITIQVTITEFYKLSLSPHNVVANTQAYNPRFPFSI